MKIKKYDKSDKPVWDEFVLKSKNGTFLFYRDYMDYHSDRFEDYSLLISNDKNKIISLLPASKKGNVLISHEGLTYGGFITDDKNTTPKIVEIFEGVIKFLREKEFSSFVYKTIPFIYHKTPAEEDRYPLFLNNANLFRRDVLSVIFNNNKIDYQERRYRSIKEAQAHKLEINQTNDYKTFWEILKWNLKTVYKLNPVHTVEEIELLAKRFKDNIKLFASFRDGEMLAGLVIYESPNVAHTQYSANSEEGRKMGAVDIIFDYLLNDYYKDKPFFDFGISNENNGRYLNKGLVEHKESFGARAVVHDFYEMNLLS